MTKCKSCSDGPRGVEGHMDLFVNTMGAVAMQFKCRTCQALWMRRQGGERLEWAEANGSERGYMLPRRVEG